MKNIKILQFLVLVVFFFNVSCDKDEECNKLNYYEDLDGDGYGNETQILESCHQPEGYVDNSLDCDDENPEQNPNFPLLTWYEDSDLDGFGNIEQIMESCKRPEGYVDNSLDCDDNNDNVNPGKEEIPGNNVDENCDGLFGMPGQIGNKWYYEGYEVINDPSGTSVKWIKQIEEGIGSLVIDSVPYYRVKIIAMKEGEQDIIYYRNYKTELDPNDFNYDYYETILNREVHLFSKTIGVGNINESEIYCADFGFTEYRYNYSDGPVQVSRDYRLKGCIIGGVEIGDVSQL